jgi:uncharacterized protein
MSVEELLAQKKELHLSSFRFMLEEIRTYLFDSWERPEVKDRYEHDAFGRRLPFKDFLNGIVEQCNQIFKKHEAIKPEDYVNDEVFQSLVFGMLEVKRMSKSKLDLWLYDQSEFIINVQDTELRYAHRQRLSQMKSRLTGMLQNSAQVESAGSDALSIAALDICRLEGLVIDHVNEMNELSEPKMIVAAADGWTSDNIRLLFHAKAKVESTDKKGNSPIMVAASLGRTDTVQVLFDLGADINCKNTDGWSAIFHASANGHTQTIAKLHSMGALLESDQEDESLITVAAAGGHTSSVLALHELGVDIHKCSANGRTSIMTAAIGGHMSTIQALCNLKADVNAKMPSGWTAVFLAAIGGQVDTIRTLHSLGADIAAKSEEGDTAVMLAALKGYTKAVQVLQELGADITCRNKRGQSAFDIADGMGYKKTADLLKGFQRT